MNSFPIDISYNQQQATGLQVKDGLFRPKNESTEDNPQMPFLIREEKR